MARPGHIDVSQQAINRPPSITSTPNPVTNLNQIYRYQLTANDPDGDYRLWSLDSAPAGMTIDAKSGTLVWQPQAAQIGIHNIAVRVTDTQVSTLGALVSQPIWLLWRRR